MGREPRVVQTAPSADTVNDLVDFVRKHLRLRSRGGSRQKFEDGYTLEPRTLVTWNFIYVQRGRVIWEVEGTPHPLKRGELILVPPGLRHRGWSVRPAGTIVSLHCLGMLPGGQDGMALLGFPLTIEAPAASRLHDYFPLLGNEYERSDRAALQRRLPGWTQLIVHEFIDCCCTGKHLQPGALDPVVEDLLRTLPSLHEEGITLGELARRAGYSPQHLNRLFRKSVGMTPLRILHGMRLDRAASLLRETELTAEAIAEQLGFNDAAYFSRAFRKQFGQSPGRYRDAASSESTI